MTDAEAPKGRGQDPDKTTGQERAAEVHERNAERQADEQQPAPNQDLPEAGEPDEADLPEKPNQDLPAPSGEDPPTDQEEHEAAAQDDPPLDADTTERSDTIDNDEQLEPRHDDLPEGARREDYADDDPAA